MAKLPDLHVSQRLKSVLPPLDKAARKKLEANIVADGEVLDPVLYWNDGKRNVVIDGINRWEIIRRLKITKYQTKEVTSIGTTYKEAAEWVHDHYDGQRHTTREALGKWYNEWKAKWGGTRQSKSTNDDLKTAEKIGKKAGVSARTVERAGARVEALSKCTKPVQRGIESGKIKATDAEVKTLSQLSPIHQDNIARDIRGGKAKAVTEAMKKRKIKPSPLTKCSADFAQAVDAGSVKISKEQITALAGLPAKKRRQAERDMMAGKSAGHAINPHRPKVKTLSPAEKDAREARDQVKIWHDTVKRWLSQNPSIDELREKFPGKHGDQVVKAATQLYEKLKEWQKVIK